MKRIKQDKKILEVFISRSILIKLIYLINLHLFPEPS